MPAGLKIHASIPWTLVATAALAVVMMYADIQNMKRQMAAGVSPAKVTELDARLDGQNTRLNDMMERVGRLERAYDWQRRREEQR